MSQPIEAVTEFVYHTDLLVSNEYDEAWLLHFNNCGTVTGNWGAIDLERSMLARVVEDLDLDPERVEIVTFTWSTIDLVSAG